MKRYNFVNCFSTPHLAGVRRVQMKLPNFFIVGAPKAGTTSLDAYLDQHPQIYMSPMKEPCFFADEFREENFSEEERPRIDREMRALDAYLHGPMTQKKLGGLVSDWDDYVKLFRGVSDEIAIGEATPLYLWSPTAARNIARRLPHAKIVMILRNPIDRAFSQYLHLLAEAMMLSSFREHIEMNLRQETNKFGPQRTLLLEFGIIIRKSSDI